MNIEDAKYSQTRTNPPDEWTKGDIGLAIKGQLLVQLYRLSVIGLWSLSIMRNEFGYTDATCTTTTNINPPDTVEENAEPEGKLDLFTIVLHLQCRPASIEMKY